MTVAFVALLLILANGLFVAMEFSLLASLRTRIEDQSTSLRGRVALRSMGRLGVVLAGTQLGVTLCSLALGSVAEPALDRGLITVFDRLGLPHGLAHTLAVVGALGVVVFVHLVIGEMVPKSVALARPEATLLALAVPVSGFVWCFSPVIWALNRLARLGARLFGVVPADELRSSATPAELGLMLEESLDEGMIDSEDHEMLVAALGFLDRPTAGIMVPQSQVVSIGRSTTIAQAEELMRTSGHSRLLVTGRSDTDVLGFVHAKDLLRLRGAERDRPIPLHALLTAPSGGAEVGLGEVLVTMRGRRRHVALVTDDRRATIGMVTLEDVLESIVGDIGDETDRVATPGERIGLAPSTREHPK